MLAWSKRGLQLKKKEKQTKQKKRKLTYNYLLVRGNGLQGFLNDPATVHLQSQGEDMPTNACCQSQLLVCASKLRNIIEKLHYTNDKNK